MSMLKRAGVVAGISTVALALLPAAGAAATTKPVSRGYLTVCNHQGYLFDVFADGPSYRQTDLAGKWDECVHWKPRVGYYAIGYNQFLSINFTQTVRIKRNGHTYYTLIGSDFEFHTNVAKNRTTRVDLGIPELA